MVKKVLFFHNAPMPYRIPLFEKVAECHSIKYYFTDLNIAQRRYGLSFKDVATDLQNIDYEILNGLNGRLKSFQLSLRADYDVLIDSLEAPSIITFFPARLRRKKTIYWSEELGWGKKTLKIRLAQSIKRFVAKKCDVLIVPGTKHRDYFLKLGVPINKILLAPNATETSLWTTVQRKDIREELKLSDRGIALYVGRLIKRKGVDILIRAFSHTPPENTLIIVGKGEQRKELEDLVTDLGINDRVIFTGYVPDCILQSYYESADVCIVPSRGEGMFDPWVFVVNEAMHCGVPVIATNAVGAAYDMIKDGITGFIVQEGDVSSLARALNEVLGDRFLSKKMGQNAQKLEQQMFSYNQMKEIFCKAIEERSQFV